MILSGKEVSEEVLRSLKERVSGYVDVERHPKVVLVQIGEDEASKWYNRSIEKTCKRVGIKSVVEEYGEDISLGEGIKRLTELNMDFSVSGILLNQPLPRHLKGLSEYIECGKDIEGVSSASVGKLVLGQKSHIPCTAMSVMKLIDYYEILLSGKRVCIVGRSNIVGKPLVSLFSKADATVILCHSKTKDIEQESKRSDILVVAIGRAKHITKEWIREGMVVIDVGTNYLEEGLCGDVDSEGVKDIVSMLSPVPGGVGILTNLMLISNILDAYEEQERDKKESRKSQE